MPAITWPGVPYPLGARFDGAGVNFAVFSEAATGVDVCLFDAPDDAVPRARLTLSERTAHVYHGYVPELKPGQLYGLRARGPWSPRDGHRFDESKLLVDPYARAIANAVDWRGPLARRPGADPNERDARDTARVAPKCVVVDGAFDWRGDAPPRVPWADSLIYEAHVKGFTARHPAVPNAVRGTYAGLASEAAIDHLKRLGVTAIELLPVHAKVDDEALVQRGLVNYWGYNTVGFFAPEGAYAATGQRGEQVTEFKEMVRALHAAGIEVLLDVVYNHTCEADEKGPTLSLRGLDNRAYYRLKASDRSKYEDLTGCGNSVDARHPATLQLVLDSLRYWVEEMHVDGFRFDLATVLAREPLAFDRFSAFFDVVRQDPALARVKLVAEPWDVAEGGYQVGGFPAPWAEWNGKYRDAVRRFWSGHPMAAEIGYRLTGSSDLYAASARAPTASVNFVVAHDGFTLADLTSYEKKHNEANGEQNRDGTDQNDSDNHGVEGPTNDPAILEARARKARALLATLFVSQGVPMLCAGDEMGRTQRGEQQRVLPRLGAHVARLPARRVAGRDARVRARARGAARVGAGAAAAELLLGREIALGKGGGRHVAAARRRALDR